VIGPDRQVCTEVVAEGPAVALAGLLDVPAPTGSLPPMWHQVHLLERPPQHVLGPDGHPTRGIPAPPGPGRKRMFAGGRVTTLRPLAIGEEATRTTWVAATVEKPGRTGQLTFVTVRSEFTQGGGLAVVEEYDVVYRAPGSSVPARPGTLEDPPWQAPEGVAHLTLRADAALLFRYSALTYNAHRIHYDHEWVREEGYADLVVHGPLQALLLAELACRNGVDLMGRELAYRLVSPMVGPQSFTVAAGAEGVDRGGEVRDVHGTVTATSRIRPPAKG
jgi:3-methylfumaryl-CoA hydratase